MGATKNLGPTTLPLNLSPAVEGFNTANIINIITSVFICRCWSVAGEGMIPPNPSAAVPEASLLLLCSRIILCIVTIVTCMMLILLL